MLQRLADFVQNLGIFDSGGRPYALAISNLLHRSAQNFARTCFGQASKHKRISERGDRTDLLAHGRNDLTLESIGLSLRTICHHEKAQGHRRWSRKFGPVVKVDRLTRETIRNDKEKNAYA